MIRFDAANGRFLIGDWAVPFNGIDAAAQAFLFAAIGLSAKRMEYLQLAYVGPDEPFYGMIDVTGKPLLLSDIDSALEAAGISLTVTVNGIDNNGKVWSIESIKEQYPHWFDYRFKNDQKLPEFLNLDVELLKVMSFGVVYTLVKLNRRTIRLKKQEVSSAPAAKRGKGVRQIKVAST